MSVGVLGDGTAEGGVTFEANRDRLRTWRDMTRTGAARWVAHEVFGGKPVQEFIGPGLTSLQFQVRLDITKGVSPREELRKMRLFRDTGTVLQFTIGGEFVGDFVIKDVNEELRVFVGGVLTVANAALSLEEYV